MKHINEAYQFFLTFPDTGLTQVYPDIGELSWQWEYHDDQRVWTLELDTDLVFTDNTGHATFSKLSAFEEDTVGCYEIPLTIKYRKSDQTWQQCYVGYLPYRKGSWDYSRATLEIKPVSNDNMRCVINNWKIKKNLFDVEARKTLNSIVGEIEEKIVSRYDVIPDPPPGVGWVAIRIDKITEYDDNQYTGNPLYIEYVVTYAREFTTSVQTSDEWTLIGGTYYREPAIANKRTSTSSVQVGGSGVAVEVTETTQWDIIDITADNGIPLKDAIEYLASQCSLSVISEFFSINSTSEEIYLKEYEDAAVDFNNVVIYQASDLIIPDANQNATILEQSFETLLGDLMTKLDLYVFYDTSLSALRIEHSSYRARRRMLNLEQSEFAHDLRGKRSYEYNESDFPQIELFTDGYEDSGVDFADARIEYEAICSSNDSQTKENEYKCENSIYDLAAIYKKDELLEEKDIRTAMVIVALDSSNNVIYDKGEISGNVIANGVFAWANVLPKYHLRNRPLLEGTINGKVTEFSQTKPIRKQNDLTVSMSRTDFFTNFKAEDRVKTQFGWGEPQSAEYNEPTQELDLSVAFRIKR